MGSDFIIAFDDFSRRYWPLFIPVAFLAAWFFHYVLFRQQLRMVLDRLRRHQITGRQGRQQLQESEERLRIILASIQTGVAVVNPVSRVVEFVNPAACRMIGLGKEKIIGRLIEEFEVREGDEELEEFHTLSPSADNVRHRELRRATGEHVPVLAKVVAITINGTVFTLKTYLDLSELAVTRRQVERLHANLTKRVQELHCLFEVAGFLGDASLTQAEVMTQVVRQVPLAMQYPHLAGARLDLQGELVCTDGYQATPWRMYGDLLVAGEKRGVLEVSYGEEPPDGGERVFSREEQALLETVCSRLARYLEGQEAARDRALFKGLMDHASDAVFVFTRGTGGLIYVNLQACQMMGMQRPHLLSRSFDTLFVLEGGLASLGSLLDRQGLGHSKKFELGLYHDGDVVYPPPATCLLLGEEQDGKVAVLLTP